MALKDYRFRPGLIPTLATLTLLPILIALGTWQVNRAQEKAALLEARAEGAAAEPVDLNAQQPPLQQVQHHPVVARGRYDAERQFLLDNQAHAGRIGYHVLTPLRLGGNRAVLVDRGWVLASADRSELPDVSVPTTPRTVRGTASDGPGVGLRLGQPSTGASGWPRRVAYLDFADLDRQLPYQLLPYLVELDPAASDGYVRDWQVVESGPDRHWGYAVQWYGMAVALLVIYVAVNLRRPQEDQSE